MRGPLWTATERATLRRRHSRETCEKLSTQLTRDSIQESRTAGGQRKWETVLPIFLIILGIVSGLYLRSGGCDSEAVENPYNSKSPGWPRPVLL